MISKEDIHLMLSHVPIDVSYPQSTYLMKHDHTSPKSISPKGLLQSATGSLQGEVPGSAWEEGSFTKDGGGLDNF
jgi:hypothetical protein